MVPTPMINRNIQRAGVERAAGPTCNAVSVHRPLLQKVSSSLWKNRQMPAESQRVPLMASPGEPALPGLGAGPPLQQTWSCRGPVTGGSGRSWDQSPSGSCDPTHTAVLWLLPGLHHLLPPQGACWAGPVLAGGGALVGLGRERERVLPRGHAPQAGGPFFCPHVPRMLLPHVCEASVLRWVSRPGWTL